MRNYTKYYFLLIGIYTLLVTSGYWKVQIDDAYIFYTYVENIVTGDGYVFNPGEKINAATSPLYTLILSVLYMMLKWTGITVPALAHISGGLILFSTAVLFFKFFNHEKYFPAQFFIPFLYLSNPLIRNSIGMEMLLVIFLIVNTFYWYAKNRIVLTAVFAALAILSRFDAVLSLIPVIIDLLLKKQFKVIVKMSSMIALLILPWFYFSCYYFGNIMPSSVNIKLAQESTGYWGTGLIFLKGFLSSFPGGYFITLIFLALLLFSMAAILNKKKLIFADLKLQLFLSWIILYLLVYGFILNPPAYPWYYTPFAVLFSILISLAVSSMHLNKKYFAGLFVFFISAGSVLPLHSFISDYNEKYFLYKSAAEWLNQQEEIPVVAIDEIGIIRFYLNKGKVRDILGLVNPEAAVFLREKDFKKFISFYNPDYIISEAGIKPPYLKYMDSDEFKSSFREVKRVKGSSREIAIYKK